MAIEVFLVQVSCCHGVGQNFGSRADEAHLEQQTGSGHVVPGCHENHFFEAVFSYDSLCVERVFKGSSRLLFDDLFNWARGLELSIILFQLVRGRRRNDHSGGISTGGKIICRLGTTFAAPENNDNVRSFKFIGAKKNTQEVGGLYGYYQKA